MTLRINRNHRTMKKFTILLAAFVFIVSCQPKQNKAKETPTTVKDNQNKSQEPVSKTVTPKIEKTQDWYAGGTPHKANGVHWKKATD